MSVLVITTGGTIGAMPFQNPLFPPKFSHVPPDGRDLVREFIESLDVPGMHCISAEHRDSKLIDMAYRRSLLEVIERSEKTGVLVTHGTDTLLETAAFLNRYAEATCSPLQNKLIVLTGAMTPLSNGKESDGFMNLTYALQILEKKEVDPGVYIVLSDYEDESTHSGWRPRLYFNAAKDYEKYYDPQDGRRHRLVLRK
ncbi:MAG: asparaginase [Alphaproteobacteria bacterium]|nr:asparaginase [Alphaproteobacteria bacterium]